MQDLEATLFIWFQELNVEEKKEYTETVKEDCSTVYVFNDYDEFENYFNQYGIHNKEIINTCKLKTTRKGTIIALKGICDYAIKVRKAMDPMDNYEYTKKDTSKKELSNIEKVALRRNRNERKESNIVKIAKRKRKW